MQNNYQKLLEYALIISTKKRYTVDGLKKKLAVKIKNMEIDESADDFDLIVKDVVARLIELNYLNDESFARDFVAERCRLKPRGKYVLKNELMRKGISKNIIEEILSEIQIDEDDLAFKALIKKQRIWSGLAVNDQKNKAFRFLSSRGFRGDTIYKLLDKYYSI